MPQISFDVSEQVHELAQRISAELGLSVEGVARNALESYLDGARTVRVVDLNEPDGTSAIGTNVTPFKQALEDVVLELEGTEQWLSTETDPDKPDRL